MLAIVVYNVWYEGGVIKQNMYHYGPYVKTKKIYMKLLYFNFLQGVMTKTNVLYGSLRGTYKARVQNGISGSYKNVFKFVAHDKSELWTSLSHHFTMEGPLQLSGY